MSQPAIQNNNLQSLDSFSQEIAEKGWVQFNQVLDSSLVKLINQDLEAAYESCRNIQIKNDIGENTDGTVHHLIGQGESFIEFLENLPLKEYIEAYFGSKFIINSLGGVITLKSVSSYAGKIHRDIRTFSGDIRLMLNMLVMLDDFTLQNGATYLMTGSHLKEEKPEEKEFFTKSDRAVGKAGTIILFDSNLWHAAGVNETGEQRRCITPTFTKPFIKQQFDYPRVIGYDKMDELSEDMLQILGFNSRTPSSLDEWYQPPEKRMYKPGQG